jgi:YtkA-like
VIHKAAASALVASLATCLALGGARAATCGEHLGAKVGRIDDAQWRLVYRTAPDPLVVGRHFGIDFALCPTGDAALPAEVRVDASMPEHKHGMNYKPSVITLSPGRYRAEGLMFHMPGRWELVFELRGSDGSMPLRLAQSLQVE